MTYYKFILVVIASIAIKSTAQAQDINFSQYFNFPALQDPTFAGNSSDSYRIAAIYRQQWKAIDAEFQTYGVAGDLSVAQNLIGSGDLGLGFYAIDDHLASDIIKNQEVGLSLAFHIPLDFQERQLLSIGINTKYRINSIDYDVLTFENQYNGFVLDRKLPTGEVFENQQVGNVNIGFGVGYRLIINTKNILNTRLSLSEILASKYYFLSQENSEILTNRLVFSSSLKHQLNSKIAFIPSIQLISFQNATDIRLGTISTYSGFTNIDLKLNGGIFYELQEAITLYGGVEFQNYSVHLSYDFTASTLNSVANVTENNFKKPSTFEISLVMKGLMKNKENKYLVPCRFF